MSATVRRLAATALALAGLCVVAAPAFGAASDPLFVFKPVKPPEVKAAKEPPPTGYLEGPCGLVASNGQLYVSDYYHHTVDVFASSPLPGTQKLPYVTQLTNEDPRDGPCGVAVDSTGELYVNNFHRDVIRFTPSAFPPTNGPPPTTYGGALSFDTAHPTGVAVEPTTNRVYVDARTYIAAYEPNGTPVMDGLEPLRIGLGSLGSGYGVTVTASGRLYVPDATTNTVKVYEPTIDKVNPVATIKGPVKGFVSLRDSSVAVDPSTGFIYVVDNQQPSYTEEPEAVVDIFNGGNAFLGVLKYKIFDALPAGIATAPSGGVFVTSGNTDQAAIYGYGANPQTNVALPPTEGATIKITGTGRGAVTSSSPAISCTSSCEKGVLTGSQLTLTATPSSGSEFAGWSGAGCPDSGLTCTVTMTEERTVEASFEALPPSGGGASLPPAGASPGPRATDTSSSSPPAARPHRHRHRHHKSKHRHRKAR